MDESNQNQVAKEIKQYCLTISRPNGQRNEKVAKEIKQYCLTIDHLNYNTIHSAHQIKQGVEDKWRDSIPTYFIYSFFTFNSIYSIDWGKTKSENELTYHSEGFERTRINKLLSFCFEGAEEQAKITFSEFIKKNLPDKFDTHDKFDTQVFLGLIKEDKNEKGNVKEIVEDKFGRYHYPIKDFKDAFRRFMKRDIPNEDECQKIAQFIYSVRCNLFHGLKQVVQLENRNSDIEKELYKLKVYTAFLNGINSFCINQIKHEFSAY
ncbi:MAG: hypothetical protein IJ154_06210 [Bacteroidales bacterium]|nr:hypothetical protein [Bacteroidales bacterium]